MDLSTHGDEQNEGNSAMNAMNYLFAAYMAIWILLALFLFSIHSREKKLRDDIERLKSILDKTE
jgi:CcmD family protein